jgi:hypothetical protein
MQRGSDNPDEMKPEQTVNHLLHGRLILEAA